MKKHEMTDEEKYEAVVNCDANYDGIFFYGVKTTGIFCRPSCQSKTPKKENLLFFKNAEEAQAAGFRPCKRCRSDLLKYKPMEEIADSLKQHLDAIAASEASWNKELHSIGISERRMVDIFKEVYGVSPKVYVDSLRLQEAQRLLLETDNRIIDIAYSVGFKSLATFNRFFKETIGLSPLQYRKQNKKE